MIRVLSVAAILCVFACTGANAQSSGAKRGFEVASVKPSAPTGGNTVGCGGGPGTADPGTLTCSNTPLLMMVTDAFSVSPLTLQAPDWMSTIRFDIAAKVPQGTTKAEFLEMLQSLLIDRFKLVVHREDKEVSKYDLVAAKTGVKIKPSKDAPPTDPDAQEAPAPRHAPTKLDNEGFPELSRPGMVGVNGHISLYAPKMTMESLATTLSNQLGKPVTDATGLQGTYEVRLSWVDDTMRSGGPRASGLPTGDTGGGPTILRAVQDQLGLRLESKKGPVQFLIIDHAEKVPTEN